MNEYEQIKEALNKLSLLYNYDIGKPVIELNQEEGTTEIIVETESRLGHPLPNDYKTLIKISNGLTSHQDWIDPSFMPIEQIDWLDKIDPHLICCYEDTLPELERCIVVGGIYDEQQFLLIPPNNNDQSQWRYWHFANWHPGKHEFKNIIDYLDYRIKSSAV